MKTNISLIALILLNISRLFGQDLQKLLDETQTDSVNIQYSESTFKTSRLINGHTIETPGRNEMLFVLSHRFGKINEGIRKFYGLDESANIRIGFEYGITDALSVGIGRSRFELYDGFLQYKLIRQQKGAKNIPFTISLFTGLEINAAKPPIPIENFAIYRNSYSTQLLIASKLSEKISIQIMPTFTHRNLVKLPTDNNDVFSVGAGGRIKISHRIALCAEYYYVFGRNIQSNYINPLSIGIDIETGGHVFQLHLTNSLGMTEKSFISQTENSWNKGEMIFGFNISRNFAFKKKQIKNI